MSGMGPRSNSQIMMILLNAASQRHVQGMVRHSPLVLDWWETTRGLRLRTGLPSNQVEWSIAGPTLREERVICMNSVRDRIRRAYRLFVSASHARFTVSIPRSFSVSRYIK